MTGVPTPCLRGRKTPDSNADLAYGSQNQQRLAVPLCRNNALANGEHGPRHLEKTWATVKKRTRAPKMRLLCRQLTSVHAVSASKYHQNLQEEVHCKGGQDASIDNCTKANKGELDKNKHDSIASLPPETQSTCTPTQRAARQTGEPCGRGSGGAVNVFGYREGWVETGRLLTGELDLRPSIGQTGGCQAGRHPPELFVWANGRHGFCGKGKPEFRGIGEPELRVIGEPGLRVGGEPELRVCARREHWRGDTCTDRGKRPCEAARSSDPSACGSRSIETIATGVGARTQAGEGCRTAMCCGVTAPPTALAPLTHPGVADDGVLVAPSALPQLRSLRRVINGEPGTARHWLLQA